MAKQKCPKCESKNVKKTDKEEINVMSAENNG